MLTLMHSLSLTQLPRGKADPKKFLSQLGGRKVKMVHNIMKSLLSYLGRLRLEISRITWDRPTGGLSSGRESESHYLVI